VVRIVVHIWADPENPLYKPLMCSVIQFDGLLFISSGLHGLIDCDEDAFYLVPIEILLLW
jgi:hypothetical protein